MEKLSNLNPLELRREFRDDKIRTLNKNQIPPFVEVTWTDMEHGGLNDVHGPIKNSKFGLEYFLKKV